MRLRLNIVGAILRRDFLNYLSNPTGYVFITVFVFAGALLTFWDEDFFLSNLCGLDTLNDKIHFLLMFFIPAVTMGVWAEERKQGTDELLLTLPATDLEIVLGKYLAALGIYLTALLFSAAHVIVLTRIGAPDTGLMVGTYLGYAAFGAMLLAVGMFGSLLAQSMAVGFILGVLLCGALVLLDDALVLVSGSSLGDGSPRSALEEMTAGVLSLERIMAVLAMTAAWLYLNLLVLRARRQGLSWIHAPIRLVAVVASSVAIAVLATRFSVRVDLTSEGLKSLSEATHRILGELDPKRPVYVRAYVSEDVPRDFVPLRNDLVDLLQEYEARSQGALVLDLQKTERYSEASREAQEKYGIKPMEMRVVEGGIPRDVAIHMGVAFTCGPEKVVVPFLYPGVPIEYELTRSIRVVSKAKRLRLGVLETDAKLFGGFDMNTMGSTPKWSMVEELQKQYEVQPVSADADYPTNLDVLLAVMPSSLTQEQMDRFSGYVEAGRPTVILDDPMPWFNKNLAPSQMKGAGRNPFMQQGGPQPQPKGDIEKAYERLGIRWNSREVVFDRFNPHPGLRHLPPEVVFVARGNGAAEPITPSVSASSGLQEFVLLFGGHLESAEKQGVTFVPVLRTGSDSGTVYESELIQRNFMGGIQMNPDPRRRVTGREYILAAKIEGRYSETPPAEEKESAGAGEKVPGGGLQETPPAANPEIPQAPVPPATPEPPKLVPVERSVRVFFFADADLVSEEFFDLYRQGSKDLRFDNVTLVMNAIDSMAGDESYIAVRSRRPRHRTLTEVERQLKTFENDSLKAQEQAEAKAAGRIAQVEGDLRKAIEELQKREDLDERQKNLMLRRKEGEINGQLTVQRAVIEDEKKQEIEKSKATLERETRELQSGIRLMALLLPPLPALLLAACVFFVRISREVGKA